MKEKYFKLTPSRSNQYDYDLIKCNDVTWKSILSAVEDSLDKQYVDKDDWSQISCKIECLELTKEEYDELICSFN